MVRLADIAFAEVYPCTCSVCCTLDGDAHRDGVAVFLTPTGLDGLIRDLQAIAASLRSSQP